MSQRRRKIINVRLNVSEPTLQAISQMAASWNTTPKGVVMRALHNAGLKVDRNDLEGTQQLGARMQTPAE